MSGNRLDEIVAVKRVEVAERKAGGAVDRPAPTPPRGFADALRARRAEGRFALIAEIKRASPSKGLIRAEFDPPGHACAYAQAGAACLSVLTDERFFQGAAEHLVAARSACALPVLRKDFLVDPWQVGEARRMGADAVLIIVAALDDACAAEIEAAAIEAAMDVLVEVHDRAELERATCLRSRLIGVNNRDLRDFSVDPCRAWELARYAPEDALIVSESGLSTHDDLRAAAEHGIGCFLVGEGLMRSADIAEATRALLGVSG